jgi:hypothetical protein
MATVPHTPASCEPLTTLVTELFGDLPAPASPLPASDRTTSERWHDAVTQVGEQLHAKLHVEALPERLHKALALVLAHGRDPPPGWHRQRTEREADLSPGAGLPLRRRHAPGRALQAHTGSRAAPPGTGTARQHDTGPSQQSHGSGRPRWRGTEHQC